MTKEEVLINYLSNYLNFNTVWLEAKEELECALATKEFTDDLLDEDDYIREFEAVKKILNDDELMKVYVIKKIQRRINKFLLIFNKYINLKDRLYNCRKDIKLSFVNSELIDLPIFQKYQFFEVIMSSFRTLENFREYLYKLAGLEYISYKEASNIDTDDYLQNYNLLSKAGLVDINGVLKVKEEQIHYSSYERIRKNESYPKKIN